jgi:hypothetical protein
MMIKAKEPRRARLTCYTTTGGMFGLFMSSVSDKKNSFHIRRLRANRFVDEI